MGLQFTGFSHGIFAGPESIPESRTSDTSDRQALSVLTPVLLFLELNIVFFCYYDLEKSTDNGNK